VARDDGDVLEVAIVRNEDLEARELLMFDRLVQARLIRARAIGARATTPYGTDGLALPVQTLPSLGATLSRLPMGRSLAARIEATAGRPVGHLIGFDRAMDPRVQVINARETFQPSTQVALRYRLAHPAVRLVVSVFENIPFRYDESPALAGVKEEVRAGADLFVANSPEAKFALATEGVDEERILVIPPGVDTDLFSPGDRSARIRAGWGVTDEQPVILYAGRLLREKGLTELLLALEPVLEPDGRTGVLVIHGAGPEEPRLRRAVEALGLRRAVRFSSWTETRDMPLVYRSADVVVLPSLPTPYWLEQFGYNLAEAMGCGCAILSTRSGSIPSTVGDAAVLVAPYDRDELGTEARRLLDRPDLRSALGDAARRRAVDTFGVDRAGHELVGAFRQALALPPR
jgi:alpha-maltose-1-phosphate synthase